MIIGKLFKTGKLKIKQHYKYDCGAACLASVAAFYGIKESLAQIRLYCGCTPQGISMQGIIDGAQALGLEAKGYRSPQKEIAGIREIGGPFIAHIAEKEGFCHYVTVYETGKNTVRIMDPATGDFLKLQYETFAENWSGYLIIITPGNNFSSYKDEKEKGLIRSIIPIIKGNITDITLAFAGAVACTATGISTTLLLQQLIDNILPKGDYLLITLSGTLVFTLMLCSLYLGYATAGYLIRSSIKIETSLTAQYMEKLLRLPAGFFNCYRTGDLSSRTDDIHNIRSLVTEGIIGTLTGILTLIVSLVIMFLYNPVLSAYIMAFIPGYWGLFKLSGYLTKKYSRKIACADAAFQSQMLEKIVAMECIRHYNAASYASEGVGKGLVSLMRETSRMANIANTLEITTLGISKLFICIILTAGSAAVLKGQMSIGQLVGFYSLCAFITSPLNSLIGAAELIAKATVSYRRITEILSLPDESLLSEEKISPKDLHGDIVLEGIKFRFGGRDLLFDGLSLRIPQGKTTLVKGESGCGKSTLMQLILRDYNIIGGSISFAGVNINQFNIGQWRQLVGYVPQRGMLFNTTLLENITMGDPTPRIDKVVQICSWLNMTYMIETFPQGLLTVAGEGGKELSGGECQKICIARALYKEPRIFIFDEITSSLDKESENCVMNCIRELKREGKTIVLISHKKENFEIADNVVHIG